MFGRIQGTARHVIKGETKKALIRHSRRVCRMIYHFPI